MLKEQTLLFKALSDPNRVRILKLLQHKELCVCEITDLLKLAASTVSQHLNVLKSSGFISESKKGRWVNYSINTKNSDPVAASILSLLHLWFNDDEIIIKDLNNIGKVNRTDLCKNKL
jgi:ArsR family transcriptional regulator